MPRSVEAKVTMKVLTKKATHTEHRDENRDREAAGSTAEDLEGGNANGLLLAQ